MMFNITILLNIPKATVYSNFLTGAMKSKRIYLKYGFNLVTTASNSSSESPVPTLQNEVNLQCVDAIRHASCLSQVQLNYIGASFSTSITKTNSYDQMSACPLIIKDSSYLLGYVFGAARSARPTKNWATCIYLSIQTHMVFGAEEHFLVEE